MVKPGTARLTPARFADGAAVHMDVGFSVGFAVNLSHHITTFGNGLTAAGALTGVQGS